MSALLRSLLLLALTGALLAGCGEKIDEATEEEAPVAEVPAEAVAEPAPASTGGYVPAEDERVPGITIDPAELSKSEAAPTEAPAK